jgi:hypothetical protein
MTWQKCPVCDGAGSVTRPPHTPGDVQTWSSTALTHICPTCGGKRIISSATGLPPHDIRVETKPSPIKELGDLVRDSRQEGEG